jgi:hypothetical protein
MIKLFQKYLAQSESRFHEITYNHSPEIVVVIPALNEPEIFLTYESLLNAHAGVNVLVLTVVNYSEKANDSVKAFNWNLYHLITEWSEKKSTTNIAFKALFVPDVRRKHAGAGYARKVGMDTAIEIFSQADNINGIIVSLDADCLVSKNYFESIIKERDADVQIFDFFHQKLNLSEKQLDAILDYEIYLHYYVLCTRISGFPYAYHTIGSCFALTVDAYVKNGGMNKKHAGEDFYFLHKLFPNSKVKRNYDVLIEPSARISDRVPFGTGPALSKIIRDDNPYEVYHPASFVDLSKLFDSFYIAFNNREAFEDQVFAPGVQEFLSSIGFSERYIEASQNSSNQQTFTKRLFQHFNAFQIVKYLNFVHENKFYNKLNVLQACHELLGEKMNGVVVKEEKLAIMRKLEKETNLRQPK